MNAIKSMMGENGLGDDLPDYLEMIQWHFVEELEHRTVAFDVYNHVCGGYFYRLFVGAWAQWPPSGSATGGKRCLWQNRA